MAETDRYVFDHREIVETLVKHQSLHDGLWMMLVEFGIKGMNVGPSNNDLAPAALVPVLKIGITKIAPDHPLAGSNLVVDAAKVNPRPPAPPPRARRRTAVQ